MILDRPAETTFVCAPPASKGLVMGLSRFRYSRPQLQVQGVWKVVGEAILARFCIKDKDSASEHA